MKNYIVERIKEFTGLLSSLRYRTYVKTKRDCEELGYFLQKLQARGGVLVYNGKDVDLVDFDKNAIYLLCDRKVLEITKEMLRKYKIWIVYEKGIFICGVDEK